MIASRRWRKASKQESPHHPAAARLPKALLAEKRKCRRMRKSIRPSTIFRASTRVREHIKDLNKPLPPDEAAPPPPKGAL